MSEIYDEEIIDWQKFILKHSLALWDVIATCEINASSDSSIKNVVPNNIESLLKETEIEHIFLLGKKAFALYNRYVLDKTGIEGIYLPSPSPANAIKSQEVLVEDYRIIKEVTE